MKSVHTEREVKLIAELRSLASDVLEDKFDESDEFLLTWIRYAKHDLKKAERYLRNNKQWRKENGMDKICQEDMKELAVEFPVELDGFDKDGAPILAINVCYDFRQFINASGGKDKFVRYLMKVAEQTMVNVRKQYGKTGGKVTSFCGVLDLGKMPYIQLANTKLIAAVTELAKLCEDNYPGVVKTLYVLNAPRMFKIVLNIFKTFLSEDTVGRIVLLDGKETNWKPVLLENISADNLPSFIKV
jgi:metal transporter CNNM